MRRWSRKFKACVKCGRTKYKHKARGLCKLCYDAPYTREGIYRKRRERIEDFKKLKSSLKCNLCGETHLACLEFHHREASKKEKTVSRMVREASNFETILKEIAKCDILCANCHRKVTFPIRSL